MSNPAFSTGFRNALLNGSDLTSLFDNGVIEIRSGTQPADADAAATGTVLASIPLPDGSTDQVTDGDMSSSANWTEGTGWSIAAGVASCDGTQVADSDLTQTPSTALVQNVEYEVTYTVSNYSAGNVAAVVGDTEGTDRSANGTYVETIVAGAGADIDIRADLNFVGDIDNVSIVIHSFDAAAAAGSLAMNGEQQDSSANATGTAAHFRIAQNGDGGGVSTTAVRIDGDVMLTGGDINIDSLSVTATDPVVLTTFDINITA